MYRSLWRRIKLALKTRRRGVTNPSEGIASKQGLTTEKSRRLQHHSWNYLILFGCDLSLPGGACKGTKGDISSCADSCTGCTDSYRKRYKNWHKNARPQFSCHRHHSPRRRQFSRLRDVCAIQVSCVRGKWLSAWFRLRFFCEVGCDFRTCHLTDPQPNQAKQYLTIRNPKPIPTLLRSFPSYFRHQNKTDQPPREETRVINKNDPKRVYNAHKRRWRRERAFQVRKAAKRRKRRASDYEEYR